MYFFYHVKGNKICLCKDDNYIFSITYENVSMLCESDFNMMKIPNPKGGMLSCKTIYELRIKLNCVVTAFLFRRYLQQFPLKPWLNDSHNSFFLYLWTTLYICMTVLSLLCRYFNYFEQRKLPCLLFYVNMPILIDKALNHFYKV